MTRQNNNGNQASINFSIIPGHNVNSYVYFNDTDFSL